VSVHSLGQNLRYAVRALCRSPAFLIVAAVTVALGIAGTTTVFSLINVLLFRPLPFPDGDRLVAVAQTAGEDAEARTSTFFSYPRFRQLHDADHGLAGIAAAGSGSHFLRGDSGARLLEAGYVSANYFDVLGVRPALGRFFAPEEGLEPGDSPLAVLSHALWQREFGGDPAVIGRTLVLDRQSAMVIGVAPAGFAGLRDHDGTELWLPVTMHGVFAGNDHFLFPGGITWLQVFGRLAPDDSSARAEARLSSLVSGLGSEHPAHPAPTGASVTRLGILLPGREGEAKQSLGILLGMTSLVLLIAAANVGGMLLARATSRRREMAIRAATGAGRGRLVRQLLLETALVFALGCALALVATFWLARLLVGLQGVPIPFPSSIPLDARVVGIGMVLALGASLLAGLAPALRGSRPDLVSDLKVSSPVGDIRRSRLRSAFVVARSRSHWCSSSRQGSCSAHCRRGSGPTSASTPIGSLPWGYISPTASSSSPAGKPSPSSCSIGSAEWHPSRPLVSYIPSSGPCGGKRSRGDPRFRDRRPDAQVQRGRGPILQDPGPAGPRRPGVP
jgi:putative ABC transport system permease protein